MIRLQSLYWKMHANLDLLWLIDHRKISKNRWKFFNDSQSSMLERFILPMKMYVRESLQIRTSVKKLFSYAERGFLGFQLHYLSRANNCRIYLHKNFSWFLWSVEKLGGTQVVFVNDGKIFYVLFEQDIENLQIESQWTWIQYSQSCWFSCEKCSIWEIERWKNCRHENRE